MRMLERLEQSRNRGGTKAKLKLAWRHRSLTGTRTHALLKDQDRMSLTVVQRRYGTTWLGNMSEGSISQVSEMRRGVQLIPGSRRSPARAVARCVASERRVATGGWQGLGCGRLLR